MSDSAMPDIEGKSPALYWEIYGDQLLANSTHEIQRILNLPNALDVLDLALVNILAARRHLKRGYVLGSITSKQHKKLAVQPEKSGSLDVRVYRSPAFARYMDKEEFPQGSDGTEESPQDGSIALLDKMEVSPREDKAISLLVKAFDLKDRNDLAEEAVAFLGFICNEVLSDNVLIAVHPKKQDVIVLDHPEIEHLRPVPTPAAPRGHFDGQYGGKGLHKSTLH